MRIYIFILLSFINFSFAQSDEKLKFAGVPAISFDPDSGMGYGLIGSMFVEKPGFSPYKNSLDAQILFSTKNAHSHYLKFDQQKPFLLPLRLISKVGFFSTDSNNYCGKASDADCSQKNQVKHFYHNRFMSINGLLFAQWLLYESDFKLSLATNYLGNYYFNKNNEESLYTKDFPDPNKNQGYLSTFELGLILDKRDFEPSATSGYLVETSVRGGHKVILSNWDYVGVNLSGRYFLAFDEQKRVVLATQSVADSIFGELPFDALSKVGGMHSLNNYSAIGGKYLGRGISDQKFVGRLKLMEQLELRYRFVSFNLLKQDFDLSTAAFGDVGMTAWDYDRLKKDMRRVYTGFGSGLRIHWNKSFIIRADLGFSPQEHYSPKFYLAVGQVF